MTSSYRLKFLPRDLTAGLVVFLVALPLCLGVALASNAPLISGVVAGIVGGLVVGSLSGSQTSVAGPAAGLTAVVAVQIARLGSFSAFLVAVFLAGFMQIGLGLARAGTIAAFFPSSVIKGLLAAIGIILILKQIPHVFGHDPDPVGEMAFGQPDGQNTFSELLQTLTHIQPGAALVGMLAVLALVGWQRVEVLRKSPVPAALVVVLGAVALNMVLGGWTIDASHLVQVPIATSATSLLVAPDWSVLGNSDVYVGALTIAIVASLETLLNLEAVDKIDPRQRESPPNRELVAQGCGNIVSGLIGGLPVTSVIVRSSVNIEAKNETKVSTIFHGTLLVGSVLLVPHLLNRIPLASLAAILLVTGFKLASPKLFKQMWSEGKQQFVPFMVTIVAIVLIDLLWGIMIGLVASLAFILASNFRRPLRQIMEQHVTGSVLRIELATQVGFFSRPALERALNAVPKGGHVLLDARSSDYIDADVLDFIDDYRNTSAPARGVSLSLVGLKEHYGPLEDRIQFVDFSSRELRKEMTPQHVLDVLRAGNDRFRKGERLTRDLLRQVEATAGGQTPIAAVLSCIDSRAPTELVFDLGIGDIFTIRIAGNVAPTKVLGSIEYACGVAGAKLILVLGHTSCGAVTAAVDFAESGKTAAEVTGCDHIDELLDEIRGSMGDDPAPPADDQARRAYVDRLARRNVQHVMRVVQRSSRAIAELCARGDVLMVGGMYDVETGAVEIFELHDEERVNSEPPKRSARGGDTPPSQESRPEI